MRVVISLGAGPSPVDEEPDVELGELDAVAGALAALARSHQVLLVLGDAFPLGILDAPGGLLERSHLDACQAERGALAGHRLCRTLANRLADREVVTLVTQVVVDDDRPTDPLAVVELPSIDRLLEAGVVVCVGAGVPVVVDGQGRIRRTAAPDGVPAHSSAVLLGALLGADVLVLGEGRASDEAGRRFVDQTGRRAAVGPPQQAAGLVAGTVGTQLVPDPPAPSWWPTGDFPAEALGDVWDRHHTTWIER